MFIRKTKTGKKYHFHPGGSKGYHSYLMMNVDEKHGIILLSNVSAFNKNAILVDELCLGLISTF